MVAADLPSLRRTYLERFLSLFAEVRGGEGVVVLLLTLNIFLILTSYLIAKVVREPLILAYGGAEVKSYSAALQAIILVLALRLYAWLVSRYPRQQLITAVVLFFAACLVGFYALSGSGTSIGVVYYVWVGIFSLMVIAQFWAFANDVYTPEQGSRLFVIVQFGASAGGVLGPLVAGALIDVLSVRELLLVAAALLLASLAVTGYLNRRLSPSDPDRREAPAPIEAPIARGDAFRVVFRNRYLLLIAMIILLTNWVNTTGEYVLGKTVTSAAQAAGAAESLSGVELDRFHETFIGSFYSRFFSIVGFVGLIVQLFLVSRLIKLFGVRIGILVLPVIAMGGYLVMAAFPVLAVIRWPKVVENATDYSLNNTVRHMLFLPTSREEKYKAKVAIDSFFVRAGDLLSALLVFVGVGYLSFGVRQFALVNVALTILWVVLAWRAGREYTRRRLAISPN